MEARRLLAASAVLLALAAGCGGGSAGLPQAAASGGCEEQHQAWQSDQRPDHSAWQPAAHLDGQGSSSWQPAAQLHGQDGGSWQPAAQPYAVGEGFDLGDWTIQINEINYNATDEVEAALAERGLTYDGTPIENWAWVLVTAALTNRAAEAASPEAELESRYVDRDGNLYIDFQCGMDNLDGEVHQWQTATLSFGVPVPPGQVARGFWGIGPADDPQIADLAFVR